MTKELTEKLAFEQTREGDEEDKPEDVWRRALHGEEPSPKYLARLRTSRKASAAAGG